MWNRGEMTSRCWFWAIGCFTGADISGCCIAVAERACQADHKNNQLPLFEPRLSIHLVEPRTCAWTPVPWASSKSRRWSPKAWTRTCGPCGGCCWSGHGAELQELQILMAKLLFFTFAIFSPFFPAASSWLLMAKICLSHCMALSIWTTLDGR